MQTTSILTANYLDILFAHRNKSYGAYELRDNYNKRASKAIILVVSALMLLLAIPFINTNKKTKSIYVAPPIACTLTIVKAMPPIKIEEVLPPKVTKNTVVKHTAYVIKKDEDVTERVAEIKDLEDKQIGIENIDGEHTDTDEATTAVKKGESNEKDLKTEAVISSAPIPYASQMPVFSGDLKEYLSKRLQYPSMAKENDVQGRVIVQFVVDEEGLITEATILRGIGAGCDEEALRVVREMPRWKPGSQNGKPVKIYMKIPIVFQLH